MSAVHERLQALVPLSLLVADELEDAPVKRRKRAGVYLYPDDPDVIEFDEDRAAVRIAAGARVTRGVAPLARAHLRSQTSIEVGGC